MQILKKLDSAYFIGANEIAQSKDLTLEARGLYFYMLSLPNDWQFSFDRLSYGTGAGLRVIRRVIKELETLGLLNRNVKNTNKGVIVEYVLFNTLQSATLQNATLQSATLQNASPYKEHIIQSKDSNKEIDSTNSAERILPKKIDSNLTFDYLAYAKEKFENASDKPKVSLDLWLEFIKSKKLVLKKYRRKNITAKMIDLNFAELYKLSEIGVNLNERLNKAIANEWQGIWFDSDSKEWQKRGGHFRNNVGHLDYDQSKNVDNPLRAIETHITI